MTPIQDHERDAMMRWIEHQVGLGPRRPGSPADRENEDYLLGQLEELGLREVRKEPIPITYWAASESELSVAGEPLESFPIAYTRLTGEAGVEGPLHWIDSGRALLRDDVRGKVVVTEIGFPDLNVDSLMRISVGRHDPHETLRQFNHPATWVRLGWHVYRWAAQHGAAGFVGILRDQPGGSCRMYGPYGFREKDIHDKPIPGFWVGRDLGPTLRARAEAGETARLRITGVQEPGVTHNVVGEIGDGEETVVLSCHHDSPFVSPVEDASGVAVVLALARHFASTRDLRRRVVVLLSAGHFYGSIGTRTFIEQHEELLERTALEISIEHVAREAVDEKGALVASGLPEATGIFVPFNRTVISSVLASVSEANVDRTILLTAEGPLGNYPPTDGGDWHLTGVPTVNCISNPVYLLTDDDAMQWVDTDRLVPMARAFAALVRSVDSVPLAALRKQELWARRLLMRLLRVVTANKTTRFGLTPVY